MHPAFSVIFFTTLSGAGFGLWTWLGLRIAFGASPQGFEALGWWLLLVFAGIAAAAGLLASFWHLGKPLRAWRAFSQWRTSWLSREGVLAVASFVPALALLKLLPDDGMATRIAAAMLAVLSIATVVCTAMIYASLKPIPAWRHRFVVPGYVLFALLTGGLPLLLATGVHAGVEGALPFVLAAIAIMLLALKLAYWRDIDHAPLSQTRGDAVGLPTRKVSVFERPHTEANYITREMGFVVARRHARKLRALAVLLFAVMPILLMLPAWLFVHLDTAPWFAAATLSALAGAFIERWLFFAEAKHMVTQYY